ncbi:hypothetical protein T10_7263 [Trichinella papuae]|uniref:histone acetyltransferase n=1 Tax=Trichinella papuae TaxID=268474 RepID=A0A0V1MPB0_9BILA|nr:hypothetical protein T10_7263 [Trichinella papuae]
MEEYVDELEGLVESLSDDEHVEKEDIFTEQFHGQCTHHARRDDRQKTFYVINHSEVENAKSQSLLQSFQAQLESDIIEMIVVHQNGDGSILSRNENRICTPERPFSVEGLAAYRRYWLQRIVDYMTQKGTKRQFDIVGKPGFLFVF